MDISNIPCPQTNKYKRKQIGLKYVLSVSCRLSPGGNSCRGGEGPSRCCPTGCPPSSHTVASFNYTATSFEGTSSTQSGFLTSGRRPESCSFCCHIRDLSLSQECYREFAFQQHVARLPGEEVADPSHFQ